MRIILWRNLKRYNVDLQSRLSQAKGQHTACESLLKVLLENKEAADTMLHLHDAAIKGCEKEKRKLEKTNDERHFKTD